MWYIAILLIFVHLHNAGAALTSAETAQLQEVFEETKVPVRLRLTLELLKKELAVCQLQQQLGKEVSVYEVSAFIQHMCFLSLSHHLVSYIRYIHILFVKAGQFAAT